MFLRYIEYVAYFILIIIILLGAVLGFVLFYEKSQTEVDTDSEVAQDTSADVSEDTTDISAENDSRTHPLIRLEEPAINERITSPLVLRGEARGQWFFEATAPVALTNWDGLIIAEGYIEAQGDWMTTDFVPFSGTLEFEKPSYGENGFLILQKANPSGLPEHADAYEIQVYFE